MCKAAVDDCLAALKLAPDWYVTSKMFKNLFTAFYADKNIHYFDEYSSNVMLAFNGMGILNVDIINYNPDDTNFNEDNHDMFNF